MSAEDGGATRSDDGLDGTIAEFCRLTIRGTEVDGVALSIVVATGSLEPAYATDAVAARVGELQFTLGEGPGVDANRRGEPVFAADLRTEDAAGRWPLFAAEAIRSGVLAVHSFPLGSATIRLGEASLYRRTSGALTTRQVRQASSVSALLAATLLHPDADRYVGGELRMSVHRAAGMVMQQMGCSIDDSLALLKATAFAEDRAVTDVADDVIERRRTFGPEHEAGGAQP